jgi:hypothetical protein
VERRIAQSPGRRDSAGAAGVTVIPFFISNA